MAILNGFKACEQRFMASIYNKNIVKAGYEFEKSGSCAVVIIIVGKLKYIT